MIRFIQSDELLTLRSVVLRNGKPLDDCRFPTDHVPGAFHMGYYANKELACIASFHPQSYEKYNGVGYQLRGMATAEAYRGHGFGNQLINFAIVYLRGQNANYIWCNARKSAARFYQGVGFELISAEFEMPDIGPHFVMYLKIQ